MRFDTTAVRQDSCTGTVSRFTILDLNTAVARLYMLGVGRRTVRKDCRCNVCVGILTHVCVLLIDACMYASRLEC